jgi:hypothetical protein
LQTNSDTTTPRDRDRRPCPPWFARVGVLAVLLLVGAAFATPPAVAAAPAAGDWPQFGRTAQHPDTNPAETAFTPGNVAGLAVAWTGQFGEADETEAGPVVAGGSVYVTGFDGKGPASGFPVDAGVYAFDVRGCGRPVCQPRGFTQLGPDQSYQGSSIAVAGGKVMLNSTDNTGAPDIPAQTNLYVLALP